MQNPIVSDDDSVDVKHAEGRLLAEPGHDGQILTEESLDEMLAVDSEVLYFYWKSLKTYEMGTQNESKVESLLRLESHQHKAYKYRQWLGRHHYLLMPWNVRTMSHDMRKYLYTRWKDMEKHRELDQILQNEAAEQQYAEKVAQEMEYIDHDAYYRDYSNIDHDAYFRDHSKDE